MKRGEKSRKEPIRVRFLMHMGRPLAYFPDLFGTHDYERSSHLCYTHERQHFCVSPWFARLLRPATRREYAVLLHELHAIGYGRLKPERIKKYPNCNGGWAYA